MVTDREEWLRPCQIYSHAGKSGMLPIGRAHFYDMAQQGVFPKPDSILGRIKLWKRSTIEAFLESRKVAA